MDYKKIKKYFGWEPKYKFVETLLNFWNGIKNTLKKTIDDNSHRHDWHKP